MTIDEEGRDEATRAVVRRGGLAGHLLYPPAVYLLAAHTKIPLKGSSYASWMQRT